LINLLYYIFKDRYIIFPTFSCLHSSICLTIERNINLRVLTSLLYVPVKEIGCGCAVETLTRVSASEGTERKNIFQRRENKWPAIQVHPRLSQGEKERATGRASSKSPLRRNKRATSLLFARRSDLPFVRHFDRGLFPVRAVRDDHYRNCFTRRLESTVHLLLRPSLLELPTRNMSEIWLSSVCAIRINKTVISVILYEFHIQQ